MTTGLWQQCLSHLQDEISPSDFETWIRPLQVADGDGRLTLFAPNRYVLDQVRGQFSERITRVVDSVAPGRSAGMGFELGPMGPLPSGRRERDSLSVEGLANDYGDGLESELGSSFGGTQRFGGGNGLDPEFVFDNFVEGKSNEMAWAAAQQVASNVGDSYNPLLLYGGVGLGKTHLMQAVGNQLRAQNSNAHVIYLHSQQFVADMVRALRENAMADFMSYYRSVDALLIDDVQFFAGKMRSQEEFFHVFNALLSGGHQMVMTCDRYPREVDGLEERLKSRFISGLSVAVEPPDLETRVAILQKKAAVSGVTLGSDVAFFVAERVRSNVRELEGVLKRIIANSKFTGRAIDREQVRSALRDLIAVHDRQHTIDSIQQLVATYYKIRMSDLLSKRRSRTVARPRQMAMALVKENTRHSLPEIGEAFGGRDHTTVLHACRKIAELRESNLDVAEDFRILSHQLSG